jgi:hypothetical protein
MFTSLPCATITFFTALPFRYGAMAGSAIAAWRRTSSPASAATVIRPRSFPLT